MQPIKMITINYWDKKLKKRLLVLKADIITIKEDIDMMSLALRVYFLQDVIQITAIALVSVINHYHINGLHLFWGIIDSLWTEGLGICCLLVINKRHRAENPFLGFIQYISVVSVTGIIYKRNSSFYNKRQWWGRNVHDSLLQGFRPYSKKGGLVIIPKRLLWWSSYSEY